MNSDQLKALRRRMNLTQAQMAEELGLSLRQYSDLENGYSRLRKLHTLALEMLALKHERGNR